MGETRFTVGSLKEIMRMASYSVKIAYLPTSSAFQIEDAAPRDSNERTRLTHQLNGLSGEIKSIGSKDWDSVRIPSEPNLTLPDEGFGGEVVQWFETAHEGDMGPQGWCMSDSFDVRLAAVLNLPFIAMSTNFVPVVWGIILSSLQAQV